MAAADGSGLVICLLQQQHCLFLIPCKGLNHKSSSAGANLGWLRHCAFVNMVSNSPEESESSQSLSDSGCSRNRSPARKQQLDLSTPSGAQQNVELRRNASVARADSSSKGQAVELSSAKDDTMVMQQEDTQLAPNKKRPRSASPEQVQVKPTDAAACRPVPYLPSLNKSPQPQGDTQSRPLWWLTPENAAAFSQAGAPAPAQAPATRLPYSSLMPRPLEGRESQLRSQFQDLSSSSQALHRQVIRPTSIPHERAVFNFGFDTSDVKAAEAADSRMSSDVHMLDSCPRFSRVSEGGAAGATGDVLGRKSFVEWRPVLSESGHHRPPSVAQVPVWNQERALPPQGPSLNYLGMAGPSSLASQAHAGVFSSVLRPNMNFPLIAYSGMSHGHQGWGTPDQLNTMQNMAAGFFPGQERPRPEASSGLLFLGPSEKNRPLSTHTPSITVVMDGRSIGGSICLRDYNSYGSFATAIRAMLSGAEGAPEECNLSNAVPGHIIAYEDAEGDVLLAGDLSWRDFVRAAKRIRILSAKGRSVVAVP